jgi:hypothetical protein
VTTDTEPVSRRDVQEFMHRDECHRGNKADGRALSEASRQWHQWWCDDNSGLGEVKSGLQPSLRDKGVEPINIVRDQDGCLRSASIAQPAELFRN